MAADDIAAPRTVALTANQNEIIQGLLRGESAVAIARAKRRGPATIRTTIKLIYRKCDVHSVKELRSCLARGTLHVIVDPPKEPRDDLGHAVAAIQDALTRILHDTSLRSGKPRRGSVALYEAEMLAVLDALSHVPGTE